MNVFRDPSTMAEMLHGAGVPPQLMPELSAQLAGVSNFRAMYHRGFNQDDGDRYGSAMPLVQALHRRIEELQTSGASR